MIKIIMILMTLTQFQLALKDKVQDNHNKFIKEYKMTARAEVNERKVWYDKILKVWRYEDNHEIPEWKDALTNKEDFTVATVNAQAERIKEIEAQLKHKEDFANVIGSACDEEIEKLSTISWGSESDKVNAIKAVMRLKQSAISHQ